MKTTMFILCLVLFVSLVLAGGPAGCGSGGGSQPAPPPAALFSGTYFYQSYAGNFGGPVCWSWWGNVVADGVSQITGGGLAWNDSVAIGGGPVPTLSYTVDAARRMTWPTGGPFNVQGGIAGDGSVAVLGPIGSLGWPGITVLVRRGGTFGPTITGTYHLLALYNGGPADASMWGTVVFGAAGSETFMDNFNGVIAGAGPTIQPYSVAPDGTVTYMFTPGGYACTGGMLLGGDLIVLSGGTVAGQSRALVILIRQSAAASAATLSGSYHIVGFSGDAPPAPPPNFSSFTGTGSADGVGMLTTNVGGVIDVDGVVAPWPPAVVNDPYVVAPNGALTVTTAATTLVGAVSPTGAFGAVAGGTTGGSAPQLWIWLR